jgi:hypothetical protein
MYSAETFQLAEDTIQSLIAQDEDKVHEWPDAECLSFRAMRSSQ